MLRAIESAQFSVSLCSYIFDVDETGLAFAEALEKAHRRGVQVRVLIDDIGSRYSFRRMHRVLQERGVPVALFLPLFRAKSLSIFASTASASWWMGWSLSPAV
jgi:cardiolipin synthase